MLPLVTPAVSPDRDPVGTARSSKLKGLRWYVVALLFVATLANYLDRQALSVAAPLLTKKFSLTERDYAHIVMAFLVSYCVMQAVAGRILDWIGIRVGMAWAFTLWSLTCVGHAFARGAFSLGICRFFLGGFEAANYPAGIKAVGEWFPPEERTIATGVFSAGSGLGAIIAPPLIAWLIIRFGWQAAFIAPGVVGLVWLLPWLLIYNEKNRVQGSASLVAAEPSKRPEVPAGSWRLIFERREFWGIFFSRMLTDPVWWFYIFWLPKYLSSARGFDLAQIALFAWVPFLGSDVFSVVGGFCPAFLIKRGMEPIRARKVAMLLSAACMPVAILAVNTPTALAAVLFISVATSGHAFFTSSLLTLPADLFPKNLVATTYGLTAAGGTIGGLLMSAYVGEMLSTIGYHPVFLVIGSLHIIAAFVLFFTIRPPKPALL